MTVTPEAIAAARAYDVARRPAMQAWRNVPDSQIARLLAGAEPFMTAAAEERFGAAAREELARPLAELGGQIAAAAVAAERLRWRAILAEHYLMGINCDHETRRDNPMCGCSRIHLGWHESVGAAVQAWIDHVAGLIGETS